VRWSSSFPTIIAFAQQKGGSAPSSSCPWLPDRCPFRRIYQPLLALRPAEWLASRPGPPPSRWQRLLRPSFLPRRSPHGEVGYHYAAVWTLAAAGLAPAGRVLLWAATLLGHITQRATPAPGLTLMRVLGACRAFFVAHAVHGPLLFEADEPTDTGYEVWAVCVCGAEWSRWVSIAGILENAGARVSAV